MAVLYYLFLILALLAFLVCSEARWIMIMLATVYSHVSLKRNMWDEELFIWSDVCNGWYQKLLTHPQWLQPPESCSPVHYISWNDSLPAVIWLLWFFCLYWPRSSFLMLINVFIWSWNSLSCVSAPVSLMLSPCEWFLLITAHFCEDTLPGLSCQTQSSESQ